MRIQTIHRNPMGDVLNECSAQGFRITTENGDVYDINTEGGMLTMQTRGCIVNLESTPELLRMLGIKQPAAVDEATAPAWRVMPFTGSWKACDERWEVYSPDGIGGVVLASEVRNRDVADLLDALAAQHQEPPMTAKPDLLPCRCGNTNLHVAFFLGGCRVVCRRCNEQTPYSRNHVDMWNRKMMTLTQHPAAVDGGAKTCYQCNRPVTWLAPDSRCGDCTRLTPDEVGG